MSLEVLASQLAKRGRNGDTMLVHMSPDEVQGLHRLALANGVELSINPHTGLVEAFSLKKIFKKLLPTLAGAALSFIPGVGPLMAAGIVGGATGLASGSLEKGLAAGLGAYGGAGIAQGLAGAGAGAASGPSAMQASGTTAQGAQAAFGDTSAAGYAALDDAAVQQLPQAMGSGAATAAIGPTFTTGQQTFGANAGAAGQGIKQLAGGAGMDKFVAAQGGGGKALMNAYWGLGPALMDQPEENAFDPSKQDTGMIRPSTFDPNTRMFTPGTPYPAKDAKNRLGFAPGGAVPGDDRMNRGYDFNIDARTFAHTPYAPAAGVDAAAPGSVSGFMDGGGDGTADGTAGTSGANAGGDPASVAGLSMGLDGIANAIGIAVGTVANAMSSPQAPAPVSDATPTAVGPADDGGVSAAAAAVGSGAVGIGNDGADGIGGGTSGDSSGGVGDAAAAGVGGGGMAGGGIAALAKGGRFLRGPGDGVSDSIPANINGGQPAALADGEFVIPARIVSELGNGSSEAGARALYAMMDRIQQRRQATTGRGRVAVDSKARGLLPA